MTDGPQLEGATLLVTVEDHSTGYKSTLGLREYATGFRWISEAGIIPGLEPRPTTTRAKAHLEETLGDGYLIHWPRNKLKQHRRIATRERQLSCFINIELAYELGTIARLHRLRPGEMMRRILLDYFRPDEENPLPPMTKEYIQSLLEQHRAGNITMPATHRRPKGLR